jgi:2-dehydropantoate 2-reductase
MRICVIGAGAIGGLLAIKLAQAGHIVSVVARGANLLAIQNNGFKLIAEDGTESITHLKATDIIRDLGPQDLVILGMKAHQVAAVVQ